MNLMAAVYDYLPISTDVLIQLGATTQASGLVYKNEYGVLVLSDEEGSTPVFISATQIARIITEPPLNGNQDSLLPENEGVKIENTGL